MATPNRSLIAELLPAVEGAPASVMENTRQGFCRVLAAQTPNHGALTRTGKRMGSS